MGKNRNENDANRDRVEESNDWNRNLQNRRESSGRQHEGDNREADKLHFVGDLRKQSFKEF